ncbi:hypothetical protein CAPTEDRAFT_227706 [Capitella teleta]|uniref:15-hydroxyprostaglandin dehydrogenase [NAD(+)] n=1 Tax=Capitella teleta TaxID=283909 RepID=R7V7K2_CAPTE|nr:hypothetical protein CAPTEDRAFT_227706 [Capitella teleta]|eukprot:ELU12356.1 hypothetical protein CAPTEDRAFT_227706 [Capitella teleta]
MKLEGKRAVITGGAQGLGKGFAEHILESGGQVALLDVKVSLGLETANELNAKYGQGSAIFIQCDVTDKERFKRALQVAAQVLGSYDILVNNAGISSHEDFEVVLKINLSAVISGTMFAVEHMREDKGGRGGLIINISSAAGLMPAPMEPIYAASKFGVVGFSRSIGPAVESLGVKVLCLCPSFARTPLVTVHLENEDFRNFVESMGLMEVSEVVEAFATLVEDERNASVLSITPGKKEYRFQKRKANL